MDGDLFQPSILPFEVHFKTVSGSKALNAAGHPGFWECGKEVEFSGVALEQHLGNSGGRSKVTIDLEWRVGVEEVEVGAASLHAGVGAANEFELATEHPVGVVSVLKASPEINFPAHRPAGPFVAAKCERFLRGEKEIGRAVSRDFVTGMQAPEVGDVAMGVLGVVHVFEPFLKLAQSADLIGGDAIFSAFSCLPSKSRLRTVSRYLTAPLCWYSWGPPVQRVSSLNWIRSC